MMKKRVVSFMILAGLFVSITAHAQVKGIPFDTAIPFEEAEKMDIEEVYGILVKIEYDSSTVYAYAFELKPKGYGRGS